MSDPYDTRPTGDGPPGDEAGPTPGPTPGTAPADPADAWRQRSPEAEPTTPAPAPPDAHAPTPRTIESTTIRCTTCGYNLTGVAIGGACPECGSRVDPSLAVAQQPTSGKAIASMVLGICSIPAACMSYGILGLPCAVIGLILWRLAKKELGSSTGSATGMNTAGLVTSIIGLSFSVLGLGVIGFIIIMAILE